MLSTLALFMSAAPAQVALTTEAEALAAHRETLHKEGHKAAKRICGKDTACRKRTAAAFDAVLMDIAGEHEAFHELAAKPQDPKVAKVLARFEAFVAADAGSELYETEWATCEARESKALTALAPRIGKLVCAPQPGEECNVRVTELVRSMVLRDDLDGLHNELDALEELVIPTAEDAVALQASIGRLRAWLDGECVAYRPAH